MMDVAAQKMLILGCIGLGICGISAWMHIKGQDGSGWGIVALCMFLATCSYD